MSTLLAQTDTYTMLEPLGKQKEVGVTGKGGLGYFSTIYSYALAVAIALAFVMIVIGGIQYSTTFADPGAKEAAKKRIYDALIGLVLALVSYLILNTINPDLVKPASLFK